MQLTKATRQLFKHCYQGSNKLDDYAKRTNYEEGSGSKSLVANFGNKSSKSRDNSRSRNKHCDHCDRRGHVRPDCYYLVPKLRPEGWKPYKKIPPDTVITVFVPGSTVVPGFRRFVTEFGYEAFGTRGHTRRSLATTSLLQIMKQSSLSGKDLSPSIFY
jgi:hypothetical protein